MLNYKTKLQENCPLLRDEITLYNNDKLYLYVGLNNNILSLHYSRSLTDIAKPFDFNFSLDVVNIDQMIKTINHDLVDKIIEIKTSELASLIKNKLSDEIYVGQSKYKLYITPNTICNGDIDIKYKYNSVKYVSSPSSKVKNDDLISMQYMLHRFINISQIDYNLDVTDIANKIFDDISKRLVNLQFINTDSDLTGKVVNLEEKVEAVHSGYKDKLNKALQIQNLLTSYKLTDLPIFVSPHDSGIEGIFNVMVKSSNKMVHICDYDINNVNDKIFQTAITEFEKRKFHEEFSEKYFKNDDIESLKPKTVIEYNKFDLEKLLNMSLQSEKLIVERITDNLFDIFIMKDEQKHFLIKFSTVYFDLSYEELKNTLENKKEDKCMKFKNEIPKTYNSLTIEKLNDKELETYLNSINLFKGDIIVNATETECQFEIYVKKDNVGVYLLSKFNTKEFVESYEKLEKSIKLYEANKNRDLDKLNSELKITLETIHKNKSQYYITNDLELLEYRYLFAYDENGIDKFKVGLCKVGIMEYENGMYFIADSLKDVIIKFNELIEDTSKIINISHRYEVAKFISTKLRTISKSNLPLIVTPDKYDENRYTVINHVSFNDRTLSEFNIIKPSEGFNAFLKEIDEYMLKMDLKPLDETFKIMNEKMYLKYIYTLGSVEDFITQKLNIPESEIDETLELIVKVFKRK